MREWMEQNGNILTSVIGCVTVLFVFAAVMAAQAGSLLPEPEQKMLQVTAAPHVTLAPDGILLAETKGA